MELSVSGVGRSFITSCCIFDNQRGTLKGGVSCCVPGLLPIECSLRAFSLEISERSFSFSLLWLSFSCRRSSFRSLASPRRVLTWTLPSEETLRGSATLSSLAVSFSCTVSRGGGGGGDSEAREGKGLLPVQSTRNLFNEIVKNGAYENRTELQCL